MRKIFIKIRNTLFWVLFVSSCISVYRYWAIIKTLRPFHVCFTSSESLNNTRFMIHSFNKVMNDYNITHWIEGGTLLGSHRYRDIIPWDHDADFGYLLADKTKVVNLVVPIMKTKYNIYIDPLEPKEMKYKGLIVDLYIFKPSDTNSGMLTRAKHIQPQLVENYFDIAKDLILPTVKCKLAGQLVNCPFHSEKVLKWRFQHTLNMTFPYKLQCWLPWNLIHVYQIKSKT